MNAFVRLLVLLLLVWLMSAGVCLGKQVYLKDGGIIDGQSAWRQGDKVHVKINRDIVADFDQSEIDLRRTFPKTAPSSRQLKGKAASEGVAAPSRPVPAAVAPASEAAAPAAKPPVQPNPPAAAPTPKPAAPPSSTPGAKESEPVSKAPENQGGATPQLDAATQLMGGFSLGFLLIFLVVCLLIVAGQWIIFNKAGQAGWKSLIPIYNMYILMIISGKPGWWMFLLFVPLVGVAVYLLALLSLARKFGKSELFGVGLFILPMIFFPLLAFGGAEYEG